MIHDHIVRLENDKSSFKKIGTYSHLNDLAYKQMPQIRLWVKGIEMTFLADSGASNSVIRMDEIDPIPKLSGNFVWSTSASGHTVREDFTVPLRCEDENGTSFKHCFLLSQYCPQNLLGRDLMCKLGVCLLASPDGIQVAQCQIHTLATIQQSQLYIYQWKLKDDELKKLVNATKDRVSSNSEIMPFSYLHCSAHVSFGRDEMFEQKWFQCTDTIDLKWLIWIFFVPTMKVIGNQNSFVTNKIPLKYLLLCSTEESKSLRFE